MKYKIVMIVLFLSSCTPVTLIKITHGNEGNWNEIKKQDLPSEVILSFQEKYKNADITRFYKISRNKYIIRFNQNNVSSLAVFSSIGTLQDERIDEQDEYYFDEDFEYWDYESYD